MSGFLSDTKPETFFRLDGGDIRNITELLKTLENMDDKTFSRHTSDIYNWVKTAVGDERLARRIKNLKLRSNAIKRLKERISFLKDVEYSLEKKEIVKELRLYVNSVLLKLDKDKCCECKICSEICPKEAIKIENGKEITDDCVLCGFCAPFCPVDAIQFFIDGKEKNILTEYKGIPDLPDFTDIDGYKVKKFLEGRIKINEAKCPEDCEECVSACPITIIERDGKAVNVDEKKCLLCGACQTACPEDAIAIKRNRIIHGDGFSSTWNKALEKLTDYAKVVLEHYDSSTKRLVKLIEESELEKWLK